MLTTHGMHAWDVIPGLPDTGGQNVFVNQFSQALVQQGFKITIANRGGYPHPITGFRQEGLHYKDPFQRLIYLEDGLDEFVRKEDMSERVDWLAGALEDFLLGENSRIDVIISHYWDAAAIGDRYMQSQARKIPHIWVPHSLGMVKKQNVSETEWQSLRIDERIDRERQLILVLDAIAATSSKIRRSLLDDYDYRGKIPFLPPCVDANRYMPREVAEDDEIWDFLGRQGSIEADELRGLNMITEISRTDTTKRKNILIQAFARAVKSFPDSCLIISIDDQKETIAHELQSIIRESGIEEKVIVVGSVVEQLPDIYALTDIYCSPSIMEGFGMSVQEAAATRVPVVASPLIPFVQEYLLGEQTEEVPCSDCSRPLLLGEGAIIAEADDIEGFSQALIYLLEHEAVREAMGSRAYEITVPYFTWASRTQAFLEHVGLQENYRS